MVTLYQKNNMRLLVGRVGKDVTFTEKDGERLAIVRLVDRIGDKVDIFFKNDTSHPEHLKKHADRVEKAKVEAGKWLAVLVLMDEKNSSSATGLDFKYQGIWTFDQGTDDLGVNKPPVTIAVGYAASPKRISQDLFRVSMAERTYDRDTGEVGERWYSISFFDDDRNLNAKKAETLLSVPGRKSVPCAIRCSPVRVNVKDEKTFYNLTGYQIETMMDKPAAVEAPETIAA